VLLSPFTPFTLSFPCCVHSSILYICISLQIGSSILLLSVNLLLFTFLDVLINLKSHVSSIVENSQSLLLWQLSLYYFPFDVFWILSFYPIIPLNFYMLLSLCATFWVIHSVLLSSSQILSSAEKTLEHQSIEENLQSKQKEKNNLQKRQLDRLFFISKYTCWKITE